MLEGKMDVHLGYEKTQWQATIALTLDSGKYPKKIQTEQREYVISIPCVRNGESKH